MSKALAEQIMASKKISGDFARRFVKLDAANLADDEKSLTIIFRASAALPVRKGQLLGTNGQPVDGVEVGGGMAQIYTANASLNGVKALVDDARIVSVTAAAGLRRGA